jgi:hypothetical protein
VLSNNRGAGTSVRRRQNSHFPFVSTSDFPSSHGHVRHHHHHQGTPLSRLVRPRGDAIWPNPPKIDGENASESPGGQAKVCGKEKNGWKYRGAGAAACGRRVQLQNGPTPTQRPATPTAPRTPTPLTPTLRVSSREGRARR